MTTFRHATSPKSAADVQAMLYDIAYVLRMTRKVKSDMLADRATNAPTELETFSRPEPGVCAV